MSLITSSWGFTDAKKQSELVSFIGITLDEKKSFSFKLSTEAIGMPAKAIDKVWKKYSSPSVIVMLNNEGTAEKTMPVIGESSIVYPQAILHWRREHSAESERINALQQKISRYNADEIKALIREMLPNGHISQC